MWVSIGCGRRRNNGRFECANPNNHKSLRRRIQTATSAGGRIHHELPCRKPRWEGDSLHSSIGTLESRLARSGLVSGLSDSRSVGQQSRPSDSRKFVLGINIVRDRSDEAAEAVQRRSLAVVCASHDVRLTHLDMCPSGLTCCLGAPPQTPRFIALWPERGAVIGEGRRLPLRQTPARVPAPARALRWAKQPRHETYHLGGRCLRPASRDAL